MKKTTLFNIVGISLMSVVLSVACSVKDDSTDPSDTNTNTGTTFLVTPDYLTEYLATAEGSYKGSVRQGDMMFLIMSSIESNGNLTIDNATKRVSPQDYEIYEMQDTNISLYKGTATFGTSQSTIYTGIMVSNNTLYEMAYIEPYSSESFQVFNYSNDVDKALMYEKLNAISNINWSVSDAVNIGARQ